MDFKVHIDKLVGNSNWTKWKRQVELMLTHQEVLDVVKGNYICPDEPEPTATNDEKKIIESKRKQFFKKDALAQLLLVGSMDEANVELTATCDSAKATWEKLISIYEQSSGQRVDRLMELFFSGEKDSTEDMVTHISRLQRNFRELNDELNRLVKTELPDLLLMSRIMSTLPAEYFEFKSVWESVPIEERTINKLTERLRLIEMRLPNKQNESIALVAGPNNKKKYEKNKFEKNKYQFNKNKRCYKCNLSGHIAKFCPKKGNSYKKPDGDAFMCLIDGVKDEDLWLADSGASAHMTKRKDYFLTYELFPVPRQIRIGNSEDILAHGQGTVNVEMLLNGKWEKNHLTEVWYVPDIDRNLFSIGKTIDRGFSFKAGRNDCIFLKDGMPRLKGIRTPNGLYALQMKVRKPVETSEVGETWEV